MSRLSRLMTILGILITISSFSLFETTSLLDMSLIEFLKGASTIVSDAVDDLVTPAKRAADYQRQLSQPANQSIVNTRSSEPFGINVSQGPTPKLQSSGSLIIECPPESKHESNSALIYESTLPSITYEGFIIESPDVRILPSVPAPLPVGVIIVEPVPTPVYCCDCGCYNYTL